MPFLVQTSPNHVAQTEGDVRRDFIFAYRSVAQDITEFNTHANDFLLDYAVVLFFNEDAIF